MLGTRDAGDCSMDGFIQRRVFRAEFSRVGVGSVRLHVSRLDFRLPPLIMG